MARVLIVAHEPLAHALAQVARHAYPDAAGALAALDVPAACDGAGAQARVRQALLAELQADRAAGGPGEVLVLCDAFGATPCNAALAAAEGLRARVVVGASVPMIWRTLCYLDQGRALDDLVPCAVAGAVQGAMQLAPPRRHEQPSPPAGHDHQQHPHQQ